MPTIYIVTLLIKNCHSYHVVMNIRIGKFRSEMEQPNSSQKLHEKSNNVSKFEAARIFRDFCEATSLHGYNYLYKTTYVAIKVFWFVIIATMTVIGIVFLGRNTNAYLKSSIITNIESISGQLTVSTVK